MNDALIAISIFAAALIVGAGLILHALISKGNSMSALTDKLAELKATVAADTDAHSSAITLIRGIPQLIADAVAKALEAGATQEQLQAVQEAIDTIKANDASLADAVVAGTPAAPTT